MYALVDSIGFLTIPLGFLVFDCMYVLLFYVFAYRRLVSHRVSGIWYVKMLGVFVCSGVMSGYLLLMHQWLPVQSDGYISPASFFFFDIFLQGGLLFFYHCVTNLSLVTYQRGIVTH